MLFCADTLKACLPTPSALRSDITAFHLRVIESRRRGRHDKAGGCIHEAQVGHLWHKWYRRLHFLEVDFPAFVIRDRLGLESELVFAPIELKRLDGSCDCIARY